MFQLLNPAMEVVVLQRLNALLVSYFSLILNSQNLKSNGWIELGETCKPNAFYPNYLTC